MQNYLIRNTQVVNEGKIHEADVWIRNGRIERISGSSIATKINHEEIDGSGKYLLPGCIDDQVHFREPGLTHKATIASESAAAVAGGVTSFMEMPNTIPNALSQQLLEDKYAIAQHSSPANYSFYMGVSNDNAEEVLRTNEKKNEVCGIKIFMGSSTGNMLVDSPNALDRIFSQSELLIATHCEDEPTVRANRAQYAASGIEPGPNDHPIIRDVEACHRSSLYAIKIAQKYNTRLHVLHISTSKELDLFSNLQPRKDKRITAEVCIHHLHFTAADYNQLGYQIKCNPAIKSAEHKDALWRALLDDRLDVIATDHAPHTWEEKQGPYDHAHAGLPLVQHPLLLMWSYHQQGKISIERIADKMAHAVADIFQIKERGYIREGYWADLVIVDPNQTTRVSKENLLYKCGWSPLEGTTFPAAITHTLVNGQLVYANGQVIASQNGQRLQFER